MSKAEKENRINSLAVTFLERQQIIPNPLADQIIRAYKEGYHQAEKDLELTWEDIPEIFRISERLKTSLLHDIVIPQTGIRAQSPAPVCGNHCRKVKRLKMKAGDFSVPLFLLRYIPGGIGSDRDSLAGSFPSKTYTGGTKLQSRSLTVGSHVSSPIQ